MILTEVQILFMMGIFLGAGIMDVVTIIIIYCISKPKKGVM
jgi:hypothetical protein